MRATFELAFRAGCLAAGLWLAQAEAAEPVSPLMGATRAQVLARNGEPRSQIEVGDRLVFLYPRERVTFRGDVVVDVEPIVPEPVRRSPPAETPSAPAGTVQGEPGAGAPADPAATGAPVPGAAEGSVPPPSAPEAKVEIKMVRQPGAKDPLPLPPLPQADPVPPPTPVVSEPVVPPTPEMPLSATPVSDANRARREVERAAAAEKEQRAKANQEARRRLEEATRPQQPVGGVSVNRTWLYITGGVLAGIAIVFWLSRRRPVEAAGSGAAGSGLSSAAPAGEGDHFTPDLVEDLPYGRFEQLVVAYYCKTGVVAASTRAGLDAPVQVKISWKGESRPFAYVRCVANSAGVVDVKPIKELMAALAADDIRRGYVVTAGRFSPAARALAGEQQLTLMPGDVLLEKLNALPPTARKELMREAGLV